jgi:hypothetical protein
MIFKRRSEGERDYLLKGHEPHRLMTDTMLARLTGDSGYRLPNAWLNFAVLAIIQLTAANRLSDQANKGSRHRPQESLSLTSSQNNLAFLCPQC